MSGNRCEKCGRRPTGKPVEPEGELVMDLLYGDIGDPQHGLLCLDCDAQYCPPAAKRKR